MPRDVWTLDVFRRAYALSLAVDRASLGFPKVEQFGGIADQVRRSSRSVCALLAEGSGRQAGSDAEFRRYVRMALGSTEESALWCRYARISATRRRWMPRHGARDFWKSRGCCRVC